MCGTQEKEEEHGLIPRILGDVISSCDEKVRECTNSCHYYPMILSYRIVLYLCFYGGARASLVDTFHLTVSYGVVLIYA